jgi:chemotaxis receptor (MCP) glutamine deamidase CheD
MQAAPPQKQTLVAPDHYLVVVDEQLLAAHLNASFVLCFYDAVHEAGGMVHLRNAPAGKPRDAALTDTTLTSDLLLIEHCLTELRVLAPKARYLQARILAQVDASEHARTRFEGMREVLEAVLSDADVKLVSCDLLSADGQQMRFDPLMGKAWVVTQVAPGPPG